MLRIICICMLMLSICFLQAQNKANTKPVSKLPRPKLVVGIVVDQMRWDFLYRYYNRYSETGGFKRLLNRGFSCENTLIPYAPTVTAAGHTCVYTGSVPAIHGIAGNDWWDREAGRDMYCSEDKSVQTVGSTTIMAGQMSPRNMLTTTVTDELRIATNFKSKVIGIAIKDRGSILPAGHSATAAYWYDGKTGNWITSTYYMNELPKWVQAVNNKKLPDQYYAKGWNTLYPINTYTQSTADVKTYESKPLGATQTGFPYMLTEFTGKDYGKISSTPFGNSLTLDIARAALEEEQLGMNNVTDFLAISFSSPDYIGHAHGPNSVETEDGYLRLDKELGDFFVLLDSRLGRGSYTVFLTADHGVAHVPGFNMENKLPGSVFSSNRLENELNKQIKEKYGVERLIVSTDNYQVTLHPGKLDSSKLVKQEIIDFLVTQIRKDSGIANAFSIDHLYAEPLPDMQQKLFSNGYFRKRGGDIQLILKPGWVAGWPTGTTHGLWNLYDTHIPLLFYGWGISPGKTNREVYMTDIAPTVAALLKIQMPNGCVGQVINEVVK
jgi:predicted AlkP superfamily pyrophosphatase or phosphodiesterase